MKKLIVWALMVAMLGAGVVAALMYFKVIPNPFESPDTAEEAVEDPDAGLPTEPPTFIELDPMIVPVIAEGRVLQRVYVSMRVEVDPEAQEDLLVQLPRIQDTILETLHRYLPEPVQERRRVDYRAMKQRILAALRSRFGEVVHDVLLQSVFVQ